MSSMTPRNGLILVRPIPQKEQKTRSGIIIPTTRGTSFEFAEIIAVGRGIPDGGKHVGTDDLQVGMVVLVKSGSAMTVGPGMQAMSTMPMFESADNKNDKIGLLNQQDILAIVNNPRDAGPTVETKPPSKLIVA